MSVSYTHLNRIVGNLGGSAVLELGVLYAFTDYVKQFFEPINELAETYTTIQSALVSADRIFSLLDEKNQEDPFEGDWSQPIIDVSKRQILNQARALRKKNSKNAVFFCFLSCFSVSFGS